MAKEIQNPIGYTKKDDKEFIFQTNYNYYVKDHHMEKPYGESKTVPNQSYTVQELFEKHVAGTLPNISKTPVWEEEPTFETNVDMEAPEFDLSDATALKDDLELKIKASQTKKEEAMKQKSGNEVEAEKAKVNDEKTTSKDA